MTDLATAQRFLDDHRVMTLALADGRGMPHACSLFYAPRGFTLHWVSDPASRHSALIDSAGVAPAAVTVAPDVAHFTAIRGLQMTGTAERADQAAGLAVLTARYPWLGASAAVAAALAKARVYRFRAEAVTFIDNGAGFGAKSHFGPEDLP